MGLIRNTLLLSSAFFSFYSYRKYIATIKAVNELKVDISGIHSVSINFERLRLLVNIRMSNLSRYHLGVSTWNMVKVKQLQFYNRNNNSLIGTANTNLSGLSIKAGESIVLKDTEAIIPINSILQNLGIITGDKSAKIKIVLILNVLGREFKIDPDE